MTNQEFIANCVYGRYNKPKNHGSLVWDGKHVYSYGSHYPLLVNIGADTWLVNTARYSNTTSKHISIARGYADYEMPIADRATDIKELATEATANLVSLRAELHATSARGFRKRERLSHAIGKAMQIKGYLDKMVLQEEGAKIEAVQF